MVNKNTNIQRRTTDSTPAYYDVPRQRSGEDTAPAVDGLTPEKGAVIVGRNADEWGLISGGAAGDVVTRDPTSAAGARWAPAAGDFDDSGLVARDGTRSLTDDWDNTGHRLRNTGVAEVGDTAPADPVAGLVWLDTSSDGTSGSGSVQIRRITESGPIVASDNVVWVDALAGPVSLDLPSVVGNQGKELTVKKMDPSTNPVYLVPAAGELIEFDTILVIQTRGESVTINTDATEWGVK